MKNPLDKDVLAANAVAVGTGVQAARNGNRALDVVNIATTWRFWYKNMTLSIVLLAIMALMAFNRPWAWPLFAAQAVINVFVIGVTYASAIRISGFQPRFLFRLFRPIERHFPNTARFWWYCCLFLPAWAFMWVNAVVRS